MMADSSKNLNMIHHIICALRNKRRLTERKNPKSKKFFKFRSGLKRGFSKLKAEIGSVTV